MSLSYVPPLCLFLKDLGLAWGPPGVGGLRWTNLLNQLQGNGEAASHFPLDSPLQGLRHQDHLAGMLPSLSEVSDATKPFGASETSRVRITGEACTPKLQTNPPPGHSRTHQGSFRGLVPRVKRRRETTASSLQICSETRNESGGRGVLPYLWKSALEKVHFPLT